MSVALMGVVSILITFAVIVLGEVTIKNVKEFWKSVEDNVVHEQAMRQRAERDRAEEKIQANLRQQAEDDNRNRSSRQEEIARELRSQARVVLTTARELTTAHEAKARKAAEDNKRAGQAIREEMEKENATPEITTRPNRLESI